MTVTLDALDLTIQSFLSPCWTTDLGPWPGPAHRHQTQLPLLLTSGGHHWRPIQTCSFDDPCGIDIWWWPMKHVRFASGRYAFYWNAFLIVSVFVRHQDNCVIIILIPHLLIKVCNIKQGRKAVSKSSGVLSVYWEVCVTAAMSSLLLLYLGGLSVTGLDYQAQSIGVTGCCFLFNT